MQGRASVGHLHVDAAAVAASSLTLSANPVSSLSQNYLPQIAYSLDHASQVSASYLYRTRHATGYSERSDMLPVSYALVKG